MNREQSTSAWKSKPLLTPSQLAEEIDVSVGTLAVWRSTKRYPLPWLKIGSKVMYRREDVDAFLEARLINAEAI